MYTVEFLNQPMAVDCHCSSQASEIMGALLAVVSWSTVRVEDSVIKRFLSLFLASC
jgi:hypothetical protein